VEAKYIEYFCVRKFLKSWRFSMNSLDINKTNNINPNIDNNIDEEYSIPLDISDIITICKEYNTLGYNIQDQVNYILELGVEKSLKLNLVKQESLPHIKEFLRKIFNNPYFGDATLQAKECIYLIDLYYDNNKAVLN
jgi:hypothetical protein